jgi:hypothetical protein
MTTFDRAWELAKMPIYHGTSTSSLPSIMREGLKPTSQMPYAHFRQMVDDMGYDEDDPMFMQDFAYGVLDRLEEPTRYAIMAGSARDEVPVKGLRYPRQLYADEEYHDRQFDPNKLPVILEMPDDGTWFEDGLGRHGWGADGWMRSEKTIPPEKIKVLAQAEPDMTVGQFIEMMRDRSKEMGFDFDDEELVS